MRIATRLWIALLVTIVLVLGAGVLVRVQQEQRLLLEVTLRDRRFFAHVLEAALSREHGTLDPLRVAQGMLLREEIADAHIETRLVSFEKNSALKHPSLTAEEARALRRHEVVVAAHGEELVTYVPLEASGIAIELSEPHAVAELLARIGWWSLWTQALALAALAGVVTFVLVQWLVGTPLRRLTTLSRQLGRGELTARAMVPRGGHEVSVLAQEMNGMAEQLEQARRALEELDAERVSALEQLRHADRLRTVGQLASALAHELGTPLNVVSGHARLIEEETEKDPVRTSARTIIEQTTRMAGIIRDVLGFARRRGAPPGVQELSALALQAAHTLLPLARRHNVEIEVEAKKPAFARVNPQHLLQALTNLLNNAMQAMPEGGVVRVCIDSLHAQPPEGVHGPEGEYARLSVIDSGIGIDAADLPRLFEPFFTRKNEGEGTGLGLAVVKGIVSEHHGWITASSEYAHGSRFDIYLPASPAPTA